jgi:hypothetical protein
MTKRPNDNIPTEHGGYPNDPYRRPDGTRRPQTTAERARALRAEGIRAGETPGRQLRTVRRGRAR